MTSRLAPLLAALALAGCAVSSHPVQPSQLGAPRRSAQLLRQLAEPGPLSVESVRSADWAVERSGLINLEHPRARAAGLKEALEPIGIYFHVLRHPTHGTFLIDTGVERAWRSAPERTAVGGLVRRAMHTERLTVHRALGEWLAKEPAPVKGVFLTHLHLDHVLGMPDLPAGTPLYSGPGEARARAAQNLFVKGSTDRLLEDKGALREWRFEPDADGQFAGVLDVFGDGSLWALWVPGHTPGSVAYLARTPHGPVLFVGDTSHTAWGWEHDVEPGSFTADAALNAKSLAQLKALVARHPALEVHLGHQEH